MTKGLWIRRLLLVALISCAGAVVGARWGRAELSEQALHTAEPLFSLLGRLPRGRQALQVNGLRFAVSTHVVGQDLPRVVETYERHCAGLDGGWTARSSSVAERDVIGTANTLRFQGRRAALVACIELGEHDLSTAALVARLEHLAERGELLALGTLRVMRAVAVEPGKTHVVELLSRGRMDVFSALPSQGDVPGVDPPLVPRPARSRRLLSANVEARGESLSSYEVHPGEFDVAAWLHEWDELGWQLESSTSAEDGRVWVATRLNRSALFAIHRQGRRAWVSVLDMPARWVDVGSGMPNNF